jgi:hypothetical protein
MHDDRACDAAHAWLTGTFRSQGRRGRVLGRAVELQRRQHWRHRLRYARDRHHANNRLGKERSATGTGVDHGLFGGIQTQCAVRRDDRPINIILINDHGDPDLRRGDHLDVHPDVGER